MPGVIVLDLEIHYGTQKLRAATFGRGIWEASIGSSDGIEESSLPENAFNLFPNPAHNGEFTINLNKLPGQTEVIIYNLAGGVVKNFNTASSQVKMNTGDVPTGFYLVTVVNNHKSLTKKLTLK